MNTEIPERFASWRTHFAYGHRQGELSHLEHGVAGVGDNLRADSDSPAAASIFRSVGQVQNIDSYT